MPTTLIGSFRMRPGKKAGALKLVNAVKRDSEANQPGTLVYLVHRKLGKNNKPGRELVFYERYKNAAALTAHLQAKSWKAMETHWQTYFEGTPKTTQFYFIDRIGAFARPGAIPVNAARKRTK